MHQHLPVDRHHIGDVCGAASFRVLPFSCIIARARGATSPRPGTSSRGCLAPARPSCCHMPCRTRKGLRGTASAAVGSPCDASRDGWRRNGNDSDSSSSVASPDCYAAATAPPSSAASPDSFSRSLSGTKMRAVHEPSSQSASAPASTAAMVAGGEAHGVSRGHLSHTVHSSECARRDEHGESKTGMPCDDAGRRSESRGRETRVLSRHRSGSPAATPIISCPPSPHARIPHPSPHCAYRSS